MGDQTQPAMKFAPELIAFAEGQWEPVEWCAWWEKNAAEMKALCLPGWYLRMKLPVGTTECTSRNVASCHHGVCQVLKDWGCDFTRSDRYSTANKVEIDKAIADLEHKQKDKARRAQPAILARISHRVGGFVAGGGFCATI